MRKALLLALLALLNNQPMAIAQRKCGIEDLKAKLIAQDPAWAVKFQQHKDALQTLADDQIRKNEAGAAEKTTTLWAIPVIFHVMVTEGQLASMGGRDGVKTRCDSQIAVLNRDFNKQNSDSTRIPSGWKSLYGNASIKFAMAHTGPEGWSSNGYDIRVISDAMGGFDGGSFGDYRNAKITDSGGLNGWDVSKYLNVWCFNFTSMSGLLGLTYPISMTTTDTRRFAGVCLNYLALGKQTSPATLSFPSGGNYTLGRTLTHEIGHFFEINHVWGDDGGYCPWSTSGHDDGFSDTPPQTDPTLGNPTYTIAGGTLNDSCHFNGSTDVQPIGKACLDFMDYTDDNGMYMFTAQQAAAMHALIATGGPLNGLTQNPTLIEYPANAGVDKVNENDFTVFPNPTNGKVSLLIDNKQQLEEITVCNILGKEVYSVNAKGSTSNYYSIDLSDLSKGIYIVRCNFATGSITRKISLQ